MKNFDFDENENPIANFSPDGGYAAIFRTIACVGDSLSSGEFECEKNGVRTYHDYYEHSWGQYLARKTGAKCYNFSRGGMSAKWYLESFADENGLWAKDKAAQAYIIALGVNDVCNQRQEIGSVSDIDVNDYRNNARNFAGYYGEIIQRYKKIQPKAKFFLVTMPRGNNAERNELAEKHAQLLRDMANLFDYTYVIDLFKYAPVYDDEFRKKYFLFGHMAPVGYVYTANMIATYIDKIIEKNPQAFKQVGFIGTEWYMDNEDEL